jgi:hypothetical protein
MQSESGHCEPGTRGAVLVRAHHRESRTTRGAGYQHSAPAWGSAVGIHGSGPRHRQHGVHEGRRLARRVRKHAAFHVESLGMPSVRCADWTATRRGGHRRAADARQSLRTGYSPCRRCGGSARLRRNGAHPVAHVQAGQPAPSAVHRHDSRYDGQRVVHGRLLQPKVRRCPLSCARCVVDRGRDAPPRRAPLIPRAPEPCPS